MNPIYKIIFIICIGMSSLSARELSDVEERRVIQLIENLRQTSHPVLDDKRVRIAIHSINNPEYFFESNFTVGRFLFGFNKYRVGVNPIVFEQNIPSDALEGVLAHELIHTEDYFQGSTIGTIIPIGLKVMRSKARRKYERQTDMKLVKKGHGQKMKAYRLWQYPLLETKDLETKKKEYLTPEEFDFLEDIRFIYPELIEKWIINPPMSIEGFEDEFKKFINS